MSLEAAATSGRSAIIPGTSSLVFAEVVLLLSGVVHAYPAPVAETRVMKACG
jgi:hypothetical protein